MIRICQTPNKSIEIDNSKHDSTGFATKITSIPHQPPAGSANTQFDKTQFFFRHPVAFGTLAPETLVTGTLTTRTLAIET